MNEFYEPCLIMMSAPVACSVKVKVHHHYHIMEKHGWPPAEAKQTSSLSHQACEEAAEDAASMSERTASALPRSAVERAPATACETTPPLKAFPAKSIIFRLPRSRASVTRVMNSGSKPCKCRHSNPVRTLFCFNNQIRLPGRTHGTKFTATLPDLLIDWDVS